jgi:hypothetical protein
MSAEEEQRLADLLKHAVPQPPRELTDEEITTVHVNLPRKSWLMPALAAAAVIIIGGGAGALAATSSGNSGPPATPGTSRSAVTPQAPRTTPGAPTPVATASPSATPVPTIPTSTPTPVPTTPASTPTAVPTPTSSATAVPRKAVVVPSVIGETATQATATLMAAGLTVRLQAQAAPNSQPAVAGIVWSQSPAAGAAVAPGTRITLFYQPKS